MKHTIYIADDEKNICDLIKRFLENDGYTVRAFPNGDLLLEAFRAHASDLVILDIMMPGTDGLEICRILRAETNVPIILLTAKDTEPDYIRGITIGSDDYITKPFKPTLLLMKIHALLRRVEMDTKPAEESSDCCVGDLVFEAQKNEILKGTSPIPFTPVELKMMSYMMRFPEKSFSREELLNQIWGYESEVETRVTDETLRRIRRKLSDARSTVAVKTVWGYGYKLEVMEG